MACKRQSSSMRLVLSLALVMIAHASDICEKCNCFPYEDDNFVISCKSYKNHVLDIDFELIEWPQREEKTFKAFFNNLTIYLLPKMAGDEKVISLNLDDNSIRNVQANPFEYFMNLESISLANNLITELTKDFFKSQSNLKELNIANNSLSSIDHQIFANLDQLEELNLSHNFLTKLTADFLEVTCSLKTLRLENNKLYAIDMAYDKIDYELRQLFLAYNHFTVITSSMFEKLTKLEAIDLSNNKIANIDENTFSSLSQLKLLDLSSNNLKRVVMRLPNSIELLSMSNNNLIAWPLLNTPDNLTEFELAQNNLEYIFPKDQEVRNLRVLDVSKNIIHGLPHTEFLQLEKLNLGYNLITSIPQNLNTIAPFLEELILDGNQIEQIEFEEKTILGLISLSYLPLLTKIQPGAFANLAGKHVTSDGTETCIDLKISHNEFLSEIDEAAFDGMGRLCQLDLSYNNFTKIPEILTDWEKIDYGVDLQGNPLSCNCEDQWMLKSILETLYSKDILQVNLMELRCQSPEEFQNRRLVSFLNHKNPFCQSNDEQMQKMVQKSNFGGFYVDESTPPTITGKSFHFSLAPFTPGFFLIVVLCAVILILMILVGVRWQRDQNRKLARRNRRWDYYDDY